MARLAVGIVGCGGRARGHMQALQQFEDVAMVAVCDPIAAARNAAGDEFGVARRYASVADMLDGEHLDAAFVATPTHMNAQGALPCLEHGVNTLVEEAAGDERCRGASTTRRCRALGRQGHRRISAPIQRSLGRSTPAGRGTGADCATGRRVSPEHEPDRGRRYVSARRPWRTFCSKRRSTPLICCAR